MSFYTINSLTFSYPKSDTILENISFHMEKNHRVGLFGPNGCGKTTLVKLMMGILKPQSGEVYLEGNNIKNLSLSEIGKKVGFIFQNPDKQLFAPTVWEQMSFSYNFDKSITEKEIDEKIDYYLKIFDLGQHKKDFPFNLSLGQKQRLSIASVLSRDVDFLIMDEPSTGLDILRLKNLEKCLLSLKNKDKGYIIISHDKKFLMRHVDKLLGFNGKGVEFI